MSHKTEVAAIRSLIRKLGGAAYVTHQGPGAGKRGRGLWGDAGIPDIIVFLWEHMFFIEVKVGKDEPSPTQRGFKFECVWADVDLVVGDLSHVLNYINSRWPGKVKG